MPGVTRPARPVPPSPEGGDARQVPVRPLLRRPKTTGRVRVTSTVALTRPLTPLEGARHGLEAAATHGPAMGRRRRPRVAHQPTRATGMAPPATIGLVDKEVASEGPDGRIKEGVHGPTVAPVRRRADGEVRRPLPGPVGPITVPVAGAPPVREPRRPVRARARARVKVPDTQASLTPGPPPAGPGMRRPSPTRPEALTVGNGVVTGQPRQTRPRTAAASPDGSGAAAPEKGGGPLGPPLGARVAALGGAPGRPTGPPLTGAAQTARPKLKVARRPAGPGPRDRQGVA